MLDTCEPALQIDNDLRSLQVLNSVKAEVWALHGRFPAWSFQLEKQQMRIVFVGTSVTWGGCLRRMVDLIIVHFVK